MFDLLALDAPLTLSMDVLFWNKLSANYLVGCVNDGSDILFGYPGAWSKGKPKRYSGQRVKTPEELTSPEVSWSNLGNQEENRAYVLALINKLIGSSPVKLKIIFSITIMENLNEKLIDDLISLIIINIDSKDGYDTASEDAASAALRSTFSTYSKERAEFAQQLKTEIINMGGNLENGAEPSDEITRAWLNVRNALSSKDNKVVLNACIVGEKAAVKGYDAVLKNNELLSKTRAILNDQRRNIE